MVLKTIAAQLMLTALLSMSPANHGGAAVEQRADREVLTLVIPDRKPSIAPVPKTNVFTKLREFMGFKLEGVCNTNISNQLKLALASYSGPDVKITSLRRNWNSTSRHNHGKAVDMEFDHELIEWLVSEPGQAWLSSNSLMFYIEGRPGSKRLVPYKNDAKYNKYVFENPNAKGITGDHIHIGII